MASLIRRATGVPGALLYRDANAIAGQPFYYGILEYAPSGLLMMSGAILAFETLKHRRREPRKAMLALLVLALLTLFLGADDLLMLHESAWYVGLEESHVILWEDALLVIALVLDPMAMLQPLAMVAVAALAMLGLAATEDMLGIRPLGVGLEDYLEIIGFSFWSVYLLARAWAR
ncbi:hypothetical protein [Profundibacterium mesophilum]|uniref:Uncharacterized protein n=1 Tax=Profundibacterium mesophilum KAUST100406-0324 TaxID=1037889 RepID=A0A921NV83_9RHOB|nr:hypothetical protein [Profundibacterium mesophilum]KAF0675896.1 hypothetical protein PMES_01786 [Profundibacterium mesophilum KAUST100406-0324]